jgi:hypothetical protein
VKQRTLQKQARKLKKEKKEDRRVAEVIREREALDRFRGFLRKYHTKEELAEILSNDRSIAFSRTTNLCMLML